MSPSLTTLERARELAAAGNVVPIVDTFVEDTETPVSAFLKLRGDGPSFLLESAEQGGRLGRHSFLGFDPHVVIRWAGGELLEWEGAAASDHTVEATRRSPAPDPYAAIADRIGSFGLADAEGLPFAGGAVGLFGYDLVRTVEPLGEPNPDPLGLPDLALMIPSLIVAFDHHRHEVSIIALAFTGEGEVDAAYEHAVEQIGTVRDRLRTALPPSRGDRRPDAGPVEFESNMSREQFEGNVSRIVEYIHAGDAFQVVPSQRFTAECPVEAFSIYRGLRAVNPSPYMYFLDFGDFEIAGASPEPLVKVSGGRVETRPIAAPTRAGRTRRRTGRTPSACLPIRRNEPST